MPWRLPWTSSRPAEERSRRSRSEERPPASRPLSRPAEERRPRDVLVWSRQGCHLCEEMVDQVRAVAGAAGLPVQVRVQDLDDPAVTGPEDRQRLHTLLPVLVVDGTEVAHWRVTDDELRSALGVPGPGSRPRSRR